jgi:hypothetical protein
VTRALQEPKPSPLAYVIATYGNLIKVNRSAVAIVAELLFTEFDLEQFRCPERQVQRKPGPWITDVVSNQFADLAQSVGECVAVDTEPMRSVCV